MPFSFCCNLPHSAVCSRRTLLAQHLYLSVALILALVQADIDLPLPGFEVVDPVCCGCRTTHPHCWPSDALYIGSCVLCWWPLAIPTFLKHLKCRSHHDSLVFVRPADCAMPIPLAVSSLQPVLDSHIHLFCFVFLCGPCVFLLRPHLKCFM